MREKRWIFALLVLVFASLACSLVTGAKEAPTAQSSGGQSTSGKATAAETTDAPLAPLAPLATKAIAEATQTDSSGAKPGSQPGKYNTEFNLPEDVSMFTEMGNGAINFQTGMSINETLDFYRAAFDKAGYKERQINTSITDTTFSMVFDGHANGKAIVIQAVDLGDGNTNVNIRFEDI